MNLKMGERKNVRKIMKKHEAAVESPSITTIK
jgi:hypothetical protein